MNDTKSPSDFLDAALERLSKYANSLTPEQKEADRLRNEQDRKRADNNRANTLLMESGAPKRHLATSGLERNGEWGTVERQLVGRIDTGFLIALIGVCGPGKTQLAVELIRQRANDLKPSLFRSAMQFFMEIRESYKDGHAENFVLEKYCRPSFLVLDEMGVRSENEWENRLLQELINRRYNDVKDTLLISNHEASQLQASIGASICDRMRETGGIIECNWGSYRR